jgi:hypothetical protein
VAPKRCQGTSRRHHKTLGNLEKNLKHVKHNKKNSKNANQHQENSKGCQENSENLSHKTWKMMGDIEQHQKHI